MKVLENETAFRTILDCFSAADGGVSLVLVKARLLRIEKEAIANDKSATELLVLLCKFSKLIEILSKIGGENDDKRRSIEKNF